MDVVAAIAFVFSADQPQQGEPRAGGRLQVVALALLAVPARRVVSRMGLGLLKPGRRGAPPMLERPGPV